MTEVLQPDTAGYARAVELLHQGELVAFPTETVYGLGADATNAEAVSKIFTAKGRPVGHPLIVHIASSANLNQWFNMALSHPAGSEPSSKPSWVPVVETLAETFWPGPLTILAPKSPLVSDLIVGTRPLVGVRVPDHPVAAALLQKFGGGIAAPSANLFGGVSPTTARHVLDDLDGKIAAVIDGGPCVVGLESTIVEVCPSVSASDPSPEVTVLRPGLVAVDALNAVFTTTLGKHVKSSDKAQLSRAPGMLTSHYAPNAAVFIVDATNTEELTKDAALLADRHGETVTAVIAPFAANDNQELWWVLPEEPASFGVQLYAALRAADRSTRRGAVGRILVVPPAEGRGYNAVIDRLKKASA